MEKTKLRELNWVCKVGIIGGWVIAIVYVISFAVGFFGALLGIY